ncbi:MAG: efflux transporter outer membrane subunit [Oryzomonas sp.]|nr:efflux transporter outer membrane subunit [Oryzomonas sp.]MDR3579612.1 efflux transporter outer membrane subunit [Oryzomonas sp.]
MYGALLLFLAGCAVGPDFVRPAPPAVDHYTQGAEPSATIAADGRAQQFAKGAPVPADWWRLFNSAKLDAVVNDAITGNPSLQSAQSSLRQSQDNLRAGYGVFYPQLDAGFGASRQKSSPASLGSTSPGTIFNLFTLSATVSYALDVFGGERRMVEGLQAQVAVQQAMAQGTYLTLLGNVENTVIAGAAYREQITATEQIVALLREQAGITEIQARAGTVPYSNVLSLLSQLASFEALLPPLKQNVSHAEHLLATLAGRAPGEWAPPRFELSDFTLPGALPVTLPSELVRQRPDILAAEAQLHSAGADIGVATAALLPSFTLNGSYGQNGTSMNSLFSGNFWSIGADVSAPLFRGGTLWFKRKAAQEAYQQALAIYRQTVLAALAQIADALRALEHDAEALQAQSQALKTAGEALRLIQANYQAGTVNYLQVLTANGQYQQARIGYLQAQAQRLQDTVALFVALGGGWQNAAEVNTDTSSGRGGP